MFDYYKKVVAITGGGSGIGKSIAVALSANGAIIHILDIDQSSIDATMASLNIQNRKGFGHTCDVSNASEVKEVFDRITEMNNTIDILINSAGISHIGTLESTTEADFTRLFNINVRGVFNCMQAALGGMKKRGGVILNIASVAATMGITERFAYSMTKGAVLSMTLSVARDYIKEGIRCNCISPARIHTPFVDNFLSKNYPGQEKEKFDQFSEAQPIGRMGTPDEVAALALYLCSDQASFITGCDYPLDGGFTKLR